MPNTHSINVTLYSDSSTERKDCLKTNSPKSADVIRYDQARQVGSICGSLCIQATLEENKDHKDIRVRISDASCFAKFGNDKTTVAKFCTPSTCKGQRGLPNKKTDPEIELNQITNVPIAQETNLPIDVTSGATETEKISEVIPIDGRELRDENDPQFPDLSSIIDESSSNKNCSSNKTLRDSSESSKFEIDDIQNELRHNENTEIANKAAVTNETLRILQCLFEDAVVPESERKRDKSKRSQSVPRERSRDRETDVVRSNLSVPTRVNCTKAPLTADDMTRPEFVRMLTEIKEHTRNLHQQLTVMNSTMRKTTFNDDITDVSTIESKKNKIEDSKEKRDESKPRPLSRILNKLSKVSSNKKKKDESSQSESVSTVSTSTPNKSANVESKSPAINNKNTTSVANVKKPDFTSVKTDEDRIRVSRNYMYTIETDQSTFVETETSRINCSPSRSVAATNEIVMASKIHKLRKPVNVPCKQTPVTKNRTSLDSPEEYFRVTEQPTSSANNQYSKSPPRSSPRTANFTRTVIGNRQKSPGKPKSASAQSSKIPKAVVSDSPPSAPPSTPESNEAGKTSGVQRERQRSCFSLRRDSSSSPSHVHALRSQSREDRSQTINSNRRGSTHGEVIFHTLRETFKKPERCHDREEIIEIERIHTRSKPFSPTTMRKSLTQGKPEVLATLPTGFHSSCTQNDCASRAETKRLNYQHGKDGRSIDSSAQTKPHTSRIEYERDKSVYNGREFISGSSKSPVTRSRKIDSEHEVALMNYDSNARVERPDSSKYVDNAKFAQERSQKNQGQQKSRSRSPKLYTRFPNT